jgi:CheY-like chemotaxis protein
LLDLNLPKMNGRDVLHQLKADPRFRAIPVIILTTSRQEEDIAFCYNEGANTYIVKQPSFEGLLGAIKVIREYWMETATLPPNQDAKR